MRDSFASFDAAFQDRTGARGRKGRHPLYQRARKRLEERLDDLKAPCPVVTSCLSLHDENDLGCALGAYRAALPEGGLFLGVMLGGDTLCEVRECLLEAEIEISSGASRRTAPMGRLEDMAALLTSAGFAHPVADRETVTLIYPDLFSLLKNLRHENCLNATVFRSRRFAPRALFTRANEIYAARFPAFQGGIRATADLFFLHGWKEASISA